MLFKIGGEIKVGNKIEVLITPLNGKAMAFKPILLAVNPKKQLRWKGRLLFKGLFDGEHSFHISDNNDGSTTFVQGEKFTGILVPFFTKMINVNTKNGFVMMNEKLKKRAEKIV